MLTPKQLLAETAKLHPASSIYVVNDLSSSAGEVANFLIEQTNRVG